MNHFAIRENACHGRTEGTRRRAAPISMKGESVCPGSYWTPNADDEKGDVDGATVEGWYGACPLCIDG